MHPPRPGPSHRPASSLHLSRDRRGAVALMVGVLTPALLGFLGLTVDAGFWMVGQTRLQVAADAGAMGASFLLTNSSFKGMTAANQQSTAQTVALAEAKGAMTKLMGTLTTPATVAVASDYGTVTVTLYSQASNFFGGIFNITAPLMRATATVSMPAVGNCVLALATTGNAVLVDNNGTINAPACTVASAANIYVNSGTLTASKILAAGTITQSNSGSNTVTPAGGTPNTKVPADPYSTRTPPTASSTCSAQTFTAYSSTQYVATPGTWCQGLTVGGNSVSVKFTAGVYIVTGGDLKINGATITADSGVSFVILGGNNFSWQSGSKSTTTITAPTTGATAGIAIWQVCNSGSTQTATIASGGTMNFGSAIYLPCAALDIGDSNTLTTATSTPLTVIAKTIYVHGSGLLKPGGTATGSGVAVLTQ